MGAYSSPVRWSLAVIPSLEPTNTVNSFSRVSCCSYSRLFSSSDTNNHLIFNSKFRHHCLPSIL
ncbi:hypothetical protein LINPERPRIM_LOCUS41026 [Linum perenne]